MTRTIPFRRGARRREFLRGLGAGAALLPLLESDRAHAALAPRRLVVMNFTNGVLAEHFFPQGSGGSLDTLTLPTATAPLSAVKSDVILIGGLALRNFLDYPNYGAGHENFSCLFTGAKGHTVQDGGSRFVGGSPTLDQYVANEIAKTTKLPIKSLAMGLVTGNYWHQSRCFYRGANDPVTVETDPAKTFAQVFGGAAMSPGGRASMERLRAERKSMLDFLSRDLGQFAARVGTEDRRHIEAHLASVRELEQEVAALQPAGGEGPCAPPRLEAVDASMVRTGRNAPQVLNAQLDIVVNAFKCDVTRVAALQLSNGNGAGFMFPWLGLDGPGQEYKFRDYHDIAHRPGSGGQDKNKVDRWFVEQMVSLMRKLKAVPEGNGTMLDNTVILLANHMGNGGAHSSTNLPFILGGRGGGYLKTGQFIRANNAPTNGVFKAICNAMKVSDGFGDPKYGGELPGLRA